MKRGFFKLPEITLLNADRWHSPDGFPVSRPRFVTKYELEIYDSDGGETCIDSERRVLCDGTASFSRKWQIRNSKFPFSTTFIYFDFGRQGTAFERRLDTIPTFSEPDEAFAVLFRGSDFITRPGEAKRRLISGMGTSEVAAALGFGTVSHFCGLFKRAFGMTPGEFAKGKNFIDYES